MPYTYGFNDYDVLALVTVALTVLYFVLSSEDRATEKFILGILAAVFWFGLAVYGLSVYPDTYVYVYLYVLIGIILLLYSVLNILKMVNARMARA